MHVWAITKFPGILIISSLELISKYRWGLFLLFFMFKEYNTWEVLYIASVFFFKLVKCFKYNCLYTIISFFLIFFYYPITNDKFIDFCNNYLRRYTNTNFNWLKLAMHIWCMFGYVLMPNQLFFHQWGNSLLLPSFSIITRSSKHALMVGNNHFTLM